MIKSWQVESVDSRGARIVIHEGDGARAEWATWCDLREAAAQNDNELRTVYGAVLAQSREMAQRQGLLRWRIECDVYLSHELFSTRSGAERRIDWTRSLWLKQAKRDEFDSRSVAALRVVMLDPDRVATEARHQAAQRAIAAEMDRAIYETDGTAHEATP